MCVQYGVIDPLSWLSIDTPPGCVVVYFVLLPCPSMKTLRVHLGVSPVLVPFVGVSISESIVGSIDRYTLSWLSDIHGYAAQIVRRFPVLVCWLVQQQQLADGRWYE